MGCAASRPSPWAQQAEDTVVTRIEDSGLPTHLGGPRALAARADGATAPSPADVDKLAGMQAALAALQASHAQLTQVCSGGQSACCGWR